jgi:hypothetical protein
MENAIDPAKGRLAIRTNIIYVLSLRTVFIAPLINLPLYPMKIGKLYLSFTNASFYPFTRPVSPEDPVDQFRLLNLDTELDLFARIRLLESRLN